jgi:hypothetical protein
LLYGQGIDGPTIDTTKSSKTPNLVTIPTLDPKVQVHRMVVEASFIFDHLQQGDDIKSKTH